MKKTYVSPVLYRKTFETNDIITVSLHTIGVLNNAAAEEKSLTQKSFTNYENTHMWGEDQ